MDFVDRLANWSSGRSSRSFSSAFKLADVSPAVQQHLVGVYLTLLGTIGAAAVGVALNIITGFGGMLAIFGSVGTTMWMLSLPVSNQRKRSLLLGATALFQGLAIGPLVNVAVAVDPW
jgi:hypothetical protein